MSRSRDGYCRVLYDNGESVTYAANERETLVTAWLDGRAYHDGHDEFGAHVVCSMHDVRAIMHFTPASMAAEKKERSLEDALS